MGPIFRIQKLIWGNWSVSTFFQNDIVKKWHAALDASPGMAGGLLEKRARFARFPGQPRLRRCWNLHFQFLKPVYHKRWHKANCYLVCSWTINSSPLKRYLSVRSHERLPRKCWKIVFLASESIQSCFPLLQRPGWRKSPSVLFRSNWVKYDSDRRSDRKKNVFFSIWVFVGDCNRIWPSWIEKVLTVISCNWAPGEAGNSSGQILDKPTTHSEARKTNFQHFRGNKSSCEPTWRYFFGRAADPTAW